MTLDSSTRAKLQEEHKLLAERARASRSEADQIRTALKGKQAELNQAESALANAQNQLAQLESQLEVLNQQINQAKGFVYKYQDRLNSVHLETANLAKSLGPVAQKQKRFEDALAMVVQNLGGTSAERPSPSKAPPPPVPSAAKPQPPVSSPKAQSVATDSSSRQKRAMVEMSLSFQIDLGKESEHNFYTGLTNNISEGGVFISTTQVLDIGTKIRFPIALPGMLDPETVEGVVRWFRREGRSDENVPGGIGVQFTKISDQLKKRINQYIQHRESIFYED